MRAQTVGATWQVSHTLMALLLTGAPTGPTTQGGHELPPFTALFPQKCWLQDTKDLGAVG